MDVKHIDVERRVDDNLSQRKMSRFRKFMIAFGAFVIPFVLISSLVLPIFDDRRGIDILLSYLGGDEEEPVEPLGADAWQEIGSAELDSFCGEEAGGTCADGLDGLDYWDHNTNEIHWFVIDLGQTYTIKKIRGRSDLPDDPTDVNIYIDDNNPPTTLIEEGITTWQDTGATWVEIDVTDSDGRYIKVEIEDTEDADNYISWGDVPSYYTIFDVYGDVAGPPANNAPTQTGESPTNQSTGIDVSGGVPDLYVICNDADAGDTMNATWRSNSSGSWVDFATNLSISTGTNITQSNANFSTESTKYWWSVNLSDGTDWTNATYHFTTAANVTLSWQNVDTTYNGAFTNTTTWQNVNITINGAFTNTTIWQNVNTTINGEFTNATIWQNVNTSINGEFTNVSIRTWQNVNDTINGVFTNTTLWYNVDTTYNGAFTNTTTWQDVDTTINGEFTNTTAVVTNITITSEYPTNGSTDIAVNTSLHFTVNNTFGYLMNITVYTGSNLTNCSALLGNFNSVNNGTYYLGYHNASNVSTGYAWRVNVSDAYGNYADETYNFTTASTVGIYVIGARGYGMGMVMAFSLLFAMLLSPMIVLLWRRKRRRNEY